jgi:hypothetical protein
MNDARINGLMNLGKGFLLEDLVKSTLSKLGFGVEPHKLWQPGADAKASLLNGMDVAIECVNWYGGYIHPKRWKSIINNLVSSGARYKMLVCFGATPTKEQTDEAERFNVVIIHRNRQMDIYEEDKVSLANWMRVLLLYHIFNIKLSFRKKIKQFLIAFRSLRIGFESFGIIGVAFRTLVEDISVKKKPGE